MPNRILYESICDSDSIEELSPGAEILFYRLVVKADDYGRYKGRPEVIIGNCLPRRIRRTTEADVEGWLQEMAQAGILRLYSIDDRPFIQFINWPKFQRMRAARSKYPQPPPFDGGCPPMPADVPVYEKRETIFEKRETRNEETHTSPTAPASVPDEPLPFDELLTDDDDETAGATPIPDKPRPARAVPKPGAEAVGRLNALYRQHIQPKCKVPADVEIQRMLKTFTPEELEAAIYHCRDDPWFMDNNAHRGAAWFFGSAKRMDAYVNGKKQGANDGANQISANGRTADTASRCGPGEASPFSKFSGAPGRT